MSIKDITDYVRLTPGNTNPSVIGSMVQSEVNGTLKESKAYTDEQIKLLGESGAAGRKEKTSTVLFEKATVTFTTGFAELAALSMPSEGDILTFTVDGVTYKGVVKSGVAPNGDAMLYAGNPVNYGLPETGENWCVPFMPYNDLIAMIPDLIDEAEIESIEHTISVSAETETIHTIDRKFLPGVCLPVVDVVGLDLSVTQSLVRDPELLASLDALKSNNILAFLGNLVIESVTQTTLFTRQIDETSESFNYVSQLGSGAAIMFMSSPNTTWMCISVTPEQTS